MATEDTKEIISALQKALAWADLVLANLTEAVVVFDKHRKILFANDAFANLLGKQRIFLLGQSVDTLLPINALLVEGKTAIDRTREIKSASGSMLTMEIFIASIKETGQTIQVFHDITTTSQNTRLLEDKVKELEVITKAMIGRELKMIELKQRIADLEGKK